MQLTIQPGRVAVGSPLHAVVLVGVPGIVVLSLCDPLRRLLAQIQPLQFGREVGDPVDVDTHGNVPVLHAAK